MDVPTIKFLADLFDWVEIKVEDRPMVSFKKNGMRINVYHTTGTVSTALKHPKKGKTQLHRRNVSIKQLALIFADPRVHTGKGYYTCQTPKFSIIL